MSKKARMKEKAEKQRERSLEHAYKNSPGYLKGPKPVGPNSPVWESRSGDYKPNTQPDYGVQKSHFDVRSHTSDVVSSPPRSSGYSPAEPMARGSTLRGLEPAYSASSSLESRIDISSLPPLPADGGVELLLVDVDRGEYVLVGGVGVLGATDRLLTTYHSSGHVLESHCRILNRQYTYIGGIWGYPTSTLIDVLAIPPNRVHQVDEIGRDKISLPDFSTSDDPPFFQRAERYVAQALQAAARLDRTVGLAAALIITASPDAPYVPLDSHASGVYCVLHDTENDFAYVLLDSRSLPQREKGYVAAARDFFKGYETLFENSHVLVSFPGIALPFAVLDTYSLGADGNSFEVTRQKIEEVFGVPPARILSFPYDNSSPHSTDFVDLEDQQNHVSLRELVVKYTNRARETGQTIFEF